jgi:hypothetical protein
MRVLEVLPEAKPELAPEPPCPGPSPILSPLPLFLTRVGPFASLEATCQCQRPGGADLFTTAHASAVWLGRLS